MTAITLADSHCHLNLLDLNLFDQKMQKIIDAAKANSVHYFLNVCVELEKFPEIVQTAEAFPQVWCSVGLHPNEKVSKEPDVNDLINLAKHAKVLAIGETGLDYYRSEEDNSWQKPRFRHHIEAAEKSNLPLIIHTRQAKADTIKILEETRAHEIGGVFHCFTEDWEMAQAGMDMNFYISFSGIVTFKNAKDLQETAKKVPLEKLLIETDCPYLAPLPHRGKPNQPAYVKHVAEFLAELKGISLETLAKATTENFKRLFKIPLES